MRGGDQAERGLALLLSLLVGLLVLWPLGRLLAEALAPGVLVRVWTAPATLTALAHTLITAGLGSLVSVALGAGLALLVMLTDLRSRALLVPAFMMLLMLPPQVQALAWAELAGPSSLLLAAFGLAPPLGAGNPLWSPGGIVLLFGLHHAPLVFLALRAVLWRLPGNLIEAARSNGAAPWRVLRGVMLPLATPGIAAGAGLAFVSAIGDFGIPALLGIPAGYTVLVTLIYQRLAGFGPGVLPDVAGLGLGLALLAGGGLAGQALLARGRALTGTPLAAPPFRLGPWRLPVEMLVWLLLALVLLLPLAALLAQSLVPAVGVRLSAATLTLANYAYVLGENDAVRRAFRNSLLLAGGAAVLLVLLALPLAVLGRWRRSRLLAPVAALAELPYALPGVVLGMAMILVFLRPVLGVSLYETPWIILLAYLARFLTLALRPVQAGMAQLDPALEEAARIAGAGFGRRLRGIFAPLLAPAAAAGGILVFMTCFNELTVSALLWSTGSETVGVALFSLEQGGESTAAAAVAVVAILATLALTALGALLGRRLPPGVLPWRA